MTTLKGIMMPKFLFRASLSVDGVAGVLEEGGTARQKVVGDAITKLGGNMEAFYFAFGDEDVVVRSGDLAGSGRTERRVLGGTRRPFWGVNLCRIPCLSAVPSDWGT